jgi:hypothetical protein
MKQLFIGNAIITPNYIGNQPVDVEVEFEGASKEDNLKVEVEYIISPYPELTISGTAFANATFTFNKASAKYKRYFKINNSAPQRVDFKIDGELLIKATAVDDQTAKSSTSTGFAYL